MVWKDPTIPDSDLAALNQEMPQDQPSVPSQPSQNFPVVPSGGSLPPMSSYGAPPATWTKETMELLVEIEIPPEYMQGQNKQLFIWLKKVLMQIQFGNYTGTDQRKMIGDLRNIIFLSQQDGNEQIVFEEQLIFISNMLISKGRSDKPDGVRERVLWIMQIMKNVFQQDEAKRPEEQGHKFNLPFIGGR